MLQVLCGQPPVVLVEQPADPDGILRPAFPHRVQKVLLLPEGVAPDLVVLVYVLLLQHKERLFFLQYLRAHEHQAAAFEELSFAEGPPCERAGRELHDPQDLLQREEAQAPHVLERDPVGTVEAPLLHPLQPDRAHRPEIKDRPFRAERGEIDVEFVLHEIRQLPRYGLRPELLPQLRRAPDGIVLGHAADELQGAVLPLPKQVRLRDQREFPQFFLIHVLHFPLSDDARILLPLQGDQVIAEAAALICLKYHAVGAPVVDADVAVFH